MRLILIFACLVLLTACQEQDIKPDPALAGQATPAQLAGQGQSAISSESLTWGGTVQAVRNRANDTHLEVLSYPLNGQRQPMTEQPSTGRFIVEMDSFLEPSEFPKGTAVTVRGRVDRIVEGAVGEAPYRYPLLLGDKLEVWQSEQAAGDSDEPRVRWGVGFGTGGSGMGVGIGF